MSTARLVAPEASARRRAVHACAIVSTVLAVAIAGLWASPVALLAAGAGAGYSLSGSV
ncbi:MAG: hypothetical protein AAF567_07730 [Actinomycetota bacterium]